MRYEEMKSIKAKLLKFIFGFVLILLIFGTNSIEVSARGGCSGCNCPADWPRSRCARGSRCNADCGGHNLGPAIRYNEYDREIQSLTCTRNAMSQHFYSTHKYCDRCPASNPWHDERTGLSDAPYVTAYAPGHSWSDWYWYGDYSNHRKECTRWCHNDSVDGSKYQYAVHNLNSAHQHNDFYWHRDCTTYACNKDDIQRGPNDGTVTFHFASWTTNKSGNTDQSITSPSSDNPRGKTLVGWNKHTSNVTTYNVQQVPGAHTYSWNWSLGESKSVREVVPGTQNNRYASDNAGGVYEFNSVHLHIRAGFNTDGTGTGLTKDNYEDWVDVTQALTTRPIDQFVRPGYDIITKGWFTTKTNENTYTHNVDKIGDLVCGDAATYPFNTRLTAEQFSALVWNNHIVNITIYPHWRAHVLHVNYNTNGGVDSTGKSGVIEGATWYYDDGKSGAPQKTYYVTNTVPTKAGYVFMGWGNKATWSQERYARQIANEATGIKVAYDNTQAKSVAKTAQDWASFLGKDLAAGDQTVTFYAQWERVITYKFYYYNDEANKAYYYEGGYQDCNTASVAFHNDDDEYLYMDIYMKRCCEAAFSVQKDADSGFFLCKKLSRPSHYRWTIF